MATYSKVTRNGQITLPATIRKKLGIAEGDLVEMAVKDGKVILSPKKLIDSSQFRALAGEWREAEKEANEDIKAGRVKTFNNVWELFGELDKE
jgi:AbrB family looped-hinge helix DNA binding protein